MEVKLIKSWKNLPAGTILKSVSEGVKAELESLGVIEEPQAVTKEKPRERKKKAIKASTVNKMITESPEIKAEETPEVSEAEEKED